MYAVHVILSCSKSSITFMERHINNATSSDRFQCLDSRMSHLALLFAKRRSAHISSIFRRRRHDDRRGIVHTSIGCVYSVEGATVKDVTITRLPSRLAICERWIERREREGGAIVRGIGGNPTLWSAQGAEGGVNEPQDVNFKL